MTMSVWATTYPIQQRCEVCADDRSDLHMRRSCVAKKQKVSLPTSERFELSHEFRIGCSIDRQAQFDLRCVTSSNPTP